jgi:sugar/nucleoside kinase (ribokinase family)
LIEKILKSSMIDVFSVNENEAVTYASRLEQTLSERGEHLKFGELAMEAARVLAKNLHARIDLHTTAFSASIRDHTETVVPAFKVKVLRATGAGDAWAAGNVIGDKNGLSDECRLLLANSIAACYLSDSEGKHPTWEKLSAFLNQKSAVLQHQDLLFFQ